MKLTCQQQDLGRGLSMVSRAISNRSPLPILANILLSAEQDRLHFSATDLEMGITCWVEAHVQEEGSTAIPAKLITEFVGTLPQAPVDIAVNETHIISVQCQHSHATIRGTDPTEFPATPSVEGSEAPILVEAALLKEMITAVVFAAGHDIARPIFTGVLVQVRDNQLTLVAADSLCMAVRSAALSGDVQNRNDLLIPARTLAELAHILPAEGTVQMATTPNSSQVIFSAGHIELASRLLEGTYPNYRQIIPQKQTTRAVLGTKEFAAAIRSVTPFARDGGNIVVCSLKGGGSESLESGTLMLEAEAQDLGNSSRSIEAIVDGPDQQVIFDVRNLADVMGVLKTPEVAIELMSATRPGVIKPVGSPDFTYVFMPMTKKATVSTAQAAAPVPTTAS